MARTQSTIPLQIQPIGQDDEDMPTIEEITTLLRNELQNSSKDLEAKLAPIISDIASLKESQNAIKDGTAERKQRLLHKKAEFQKWISEADIEIGQIDNKTWDKPIAPLENAGNVNIMIENPERANHGGGTRFQANSMPKYSFGQDVHTWILEMDHIVGLWGELIVCPHIFSHCFESGDIIRTWYRSQGPVIQQAVTQDTGCWNRFKTAMKTKWSKPLAIRQNEADERVKRPDESYTEYCISKADLCMTAYPECDESTLIEKIRSWMDIEADKFCSELYSLDRFTNELIRYDHILSHSLIPYQSSYKTRSGTHTDFGYKNDSRGNSAGNNARATSTALTLAGRPGMRSSPDDTHKSSTGHQDPAQRKLSTKDRMNPETNKMTRSFTNRDGVIKFIQRPCDKCLTKGRTEWHFRFECPHDPGLKTYLLAHKDVAGGMRLEGMNDSPSGMQTSYTFHGNQMAYANAILQYNGDDYDSDEAGNGSPDQ